MSVLWGLKETQVMWKKTKCLTFIHPLDHWHPQSNNQVLPGEKYWQPSVKHDNGDCSLISPIVCSECCDCATPICDAHCLPHLSHFKCRVIVWSWVGGLHSFYCHFSRRFSSLNFTALIEAFHQATLLHVPLADILQTKWWSGVHG